MAQDRACLFGAVIDAEVRVSEAGLVIESWWRYLPGKFPGVMMDVFVVMPNHLHGIVLIGTGGQDDGGDQWEMMVAGPGAHTGH